MEKFDTFKDHFLSLYQSAVSDVARKIDEKPTLTSRAALQRSARSVLPDVAADIARREFARQRGLPVPPIGMTTRELTKPEIAAVCANLAFQYLKARLSNDAVALSELNDEFKAGTCDPAWLSTIDEYVQYFGKGGGRNEIPYIRAATVGAHIIEIKPDAKIAIVGDWGTGAQPALRVLKHIADDKPDVLIHLGDIYYSGTPLECETNFSDPVNRIVRASNPDTKIFTLSGNHDMYCGGVGYYELIKTLNPAPFVQPASFFCLRTSDLRWQFLAMDTGLHDYSPTSVAETITYLESDELDWHVQRVNEFPGKTILLSHHQLFSAFSAIGSAPNGQRSSLNPKLYEAFQKLNHSNKIAAWYWGHEHTLSIYDPYAGLQRGRCLGHGAVPTSTADRIYRPLPDLTDAPSIKDRTQLAQVGGVYAHGYSVLALQPDFCSATYFQDMAGRKNQMFEERID
ncbi:metallophosphoesterase family protein [Tardiphaga sp. 619_E2_N8_5]|uniref:metallophosphoesterase family protein n=1 Tax=unclassified Tardiphaga TaxID=2631404 RepID=UPI003F1F1D96